MADYLVANAINALNKNIVFGQKQINVNLAAINANLAEINIVLASELGPAASGVPGSIRNSLAGQATELTNLSEILEKMRESQDSLVTSLGELSSTVKTTNSTLGDMATVQSIAAADQMATNSFQKQETLAALKRNSIEPATLPTIQEIIKEAIDNSSIMRASAEFQSAVSSVTNNILSTISDYIKQSAIYVWGKETLETFWTNLGLSKAAKALKDPAGVVGVANRTAANAVTKAGGWKPSTTEPITWT